MMRRSQTLLRVSAFSLYMQDLGKTGTLKGDRKATKTSAKLYRQLSTPEKTALAKRAKRISYPALDAYNRFQKEYAHRFLHLSNRKRQREVANLWAELKKNGTVKVPKSPKSASSKVKKAAKEVEKPKKVLKAKKAHK
ncbi:putative mitochondrial Kinetoplast DNA-associated protein [Leptomonas pyrrhocoris]|uniref:Putative mitochondrial Kinetoplast DNA-associated protein n=1 Tax=Leptomonas pyrrhocoris TaxID=157538 RepID=A0A0M9G8S0_LEPPY|nr:putative mitochondrial Kinetoplast DNA-associated protein [Leptomonas pyrrhocoris]KPA85027.1 putative mitochondrial Kinetoplast DNA-associated protein [Leptomonas pyrrhocoris]|eukprot:XP_015663466.1 putative mitochondrial Kinetoplast DNA-associated protein [Leptomonas pyrrhocoris]